MRIEQLRYLAEIATSHSMTITAENLYTTQPTISNAIKALEKELGVALLIRSKNGVYLTAAGHEILTAAEKILDQVDDIYGIANKHQQAAPPSFTGCLTIQAAPSCTLSFLPKIIDTFHAKFPDVTFQIMENNPDEIIKNLWDKTYDLNLFTTLDTTVKAGILAKAQALPQFQLEDLFAQRLCAAVSTASPLASKKSIPLAECAQYPLGTLAYAKNDLDFLSRSFKGFKNLNIVLHTNNVQVLIEAIAKNQCLSITSLSSTENPNVAMIPISNMPRLQFYSSYFANNPKCALIATFVALLKI